MTPLDLIRPAGQFTLFRVDDVDGDSEARERWWAYLMATRAFIGIAMCVALASSPAFGPNRVPVAFIAALGTLLSNATYYVVAWRSDRMTRGIPVLEFLGVGVLGIFAPSVFPAGMVIMAVAMGIWTIAFGPRFGFLLLAGSVPLYGLITLVTRPPGGAVSWLIFSLGSLLATVVNGVVSLQIHGVKDRYTELVETMLAIVWERNGPHHPMTFVNRIVEDILGVETSEWIDDERRLARVHPDDRWLLEHRPGVATTREYRFLRPDGSQVWLLETVIPAPTELHPERQRGIVVDTTAARRTLERAEHLSKVMSEVPIPLWVVEVDDVDSPRSAQLVALNGAAGTDQMWGAVEAGSELISWVGAPADRQSELDVLRNAFEGTMADGQLRVVELNGWADEQGRTRSVRLRVFDLGARTFGIAAEDVSAEADAADALRHAATHDALTGLGNRTLLQEKLAEALTSDGSPPSATLLMMDLNQFKEVNDALGHLHGDRLLRELSHRLQGVAEPGMTVARLGGDEFAVLIPGAVPGGGAATLAQSIIEAFSEPVLIDDISLQTTVSVGIASAPRDGTDAEALLQHADIAMYQAKVQGTGFAVFSPDDSSSRLRRLRLTGDLPAAIENEEFIVHYQPKFDLATGLASDCEALVRWRHPEFGVLGPVEFIELAEVSGHIPALAKQVIRSAMEEISSLEARFGRIGLAVNLSVRNLYDPGLLDTIRRSCDSTGVDPSSLTVEVTESELMDDPGLALQVLLRLRELGLGVSIDDFGTGYSSLAYLRNLPATELKVDRSFVNALSDDDDIVVRTIIELGHNLGMKVIAEGVETVHQRDLLASLGCDGVQGYLYCHPLGIEDLRRHLSMRETAEPGIEERLLERT